MFKKKTLCMLLLLPFIGGVASWASGIAAPIDNEVQQNSTLQGKVVDQDGEPIYGAAVVVVETKAMTLTASDGTFKLNNVRVGQNIRVSLLGYKTQTIKWAGMGLTLTVPLSQLLSVQCLKNQFLKLYFVPASSLFQTEPLILSSIF